MDPRRFALAVAVAALVAVPIGVWAPLQIWAGRLPEPLATHWGADGVANGSMSRLTLAVLAIGLGWLPALVLGARALPRSGQGPADVPALPVWVALAVMFALLLPAMTWLTSAVNAGHPDWRSVPGPPSLTVGALILAAGAAGIGTGVVAARRTSSRP